MSDNIILTEDFNVELEEDNMFDFLNIYKLAYLVEQKKLYEPRQSFMYRFSSNKLTFKFSKY